MRRFRKTQDLAVGEDSFLDIVANLVGIMIILVMVVGARAKDAMRQSEEAQQSTTPSAPVSTEDVATEEEVAEALAAEKQVEDDIHRLANQLVQQELEVDYRKSERDRVQLMVAMAEESLAEMRNQLDDQERAEFDRRSELAISQAELDKLREQIVSVQNSLPETKVLAHYPTPMAKTVFGKELHLRLGAGRLVHVPWDEFIQLLKDDAPKKTWRLRDQDEFTELIGPVGGFWMRYTLKRQVHVLNTKVGVATQQAITLDKFTLIPENEQAGELTADALRDGSAFMTLLSHHRPEATTVTVWTYPDSFEDFRQLKEELFRRGFVTAARPLPADHPIGGSPDGTRSAAQ